MVRSDHRRLLVIGLTFVLLVLMHNAATPVFEAPDEVWHYAYVRWIAEGFMACQRSTAMRAVPLSRLHSPCCITCLPHSLVARSPTRISPPFLSTTLGSATGAGDLSR